MAFHLGSLGFLTPFKFETYQSQVTQVIEGISLSSEARCASGPKLTSLFIAGNAAIVLRSRLKVRVFKENWEKKARVDDMGIILTNGDVDCGRKVAQYQVTAHKFSPSSCQENSWAFAHISLHWLFHMTTRADGCFPHKRRATQLPIVQLRKDSSRPLIPQCTLVKWKSRWYIPLKPQVFSSLPWG